MIILDNIIFTLQNNGGISVYWSELCKRLMNKKEEYFFIEFKNKNSQRNQFTIPDTKLIRNNFYSFLERFKNPHFNNNLNKIYIFHSSYYRISRMKNAKNIVTIHDFIHEKYYSGLRKYIIIFLKRRSLNNATAIITVSNNTMNDLFQYYPKIDKKKVYVIYNGVSSSFKKLENINTEKEILFIGSRQKYKNFNFAVKAVSSLNSYKLIIVGQKLNKTELKLLNKYLPKRWGLFTNINNDELNHLYNKSFALLYPSFYEGFGIPIIEAMKSGCPFIAFNNDVMLEISSGAGVLLNSLKIEEFQNAINNIHNNRNYYIKSGLEVSKNYTWDKCFDQTYKLYKQILEC